VSNNVESDRLGKGTALSNGDNISFLDGKGRTAVGSNILVSLFETTVLSDVVKVISSYNDSSLHLGGDDLSGQNSSSNGDVSGKGALLVDEGSLNGGIGGLDSESNVLYETHGLLAGGTDGTLAGDKDGILLLVGLFVLIALDVILSYADHFLLYLLSYLRKNKTIEREKRKMN
jgi:hypothetical protein